MTTIRTIPREVLNFRKQKTLFVLSSEQKAVLIGTLLGDGSLNKRGKEYRLHIKHGYSQHFFVQYKREVFSNITSMPVRVFSQQVKHKKYQFAEFVTLTHPVFTEYRTLFYPGGKKIITAKVIHNLKDPQSLAVWFMDDGSSEYASVAFHTQCFSIEELILLQQCLQESFGLKTTLRRNKRGWIIYVLKTSFDSFKNIVHPFILPQFAYKLKPFHENPVETACQRLIF